MLFALPFGAGWYTAGGAKTLAYEAATNAVLPFCVKEVLADPTAVAELKVKRVSDYDDVVRDHYKGATHPRPTIIRCGGHAESCSKGKYRGPLPTDRRENARKASVSEAFAESTIGLLLHSQ
jgi:hypothetical protein